MFFPINCVRNKTKQSDQILSFNFLKITLFIYLFLAVLSLCCFVWAFSGYCELGLLFVAVPGLLTAVVFLLQSTDSRRAGQWLQLVVSRAQGSLVAVHPLSFSMACGIFSDQGLNPCPLLCVFTAPPGKSHLVIFDVRFNSQFQLEMYII